jgi:cysteine sulfinate desulfinase/cysteine desulfurase-like protein
MGIAALRFSFGRSSSATDLDALVGALPRIVEKVRGLAAILHR